MQGVLYKEYYTRTTIQGLLYTRSVVQGALYRECYTRSTIQGVLYKEYYTRSFIQGLHIQRVLGGGPTPFLPMGKMCLSHFSPWGKMGKKVYGKRGKSIHFPLFPYTFFPIFSHGQKRGWTPPVLYKEYYTRRTIQGVLYNDYYTRSTIHGVLYVLNTAARNLNYIPFS